MQNEYGSKAERKPRVPLMKFVAILTAIVSLDLFALYFLLFLMKSNLAHFIGQIMRL